MPYIVLIAEDCDDVREFMVTLLNLQGFEVCEAHDGCEALKVVNVCHPDLILMDIAMPVMDGLEATRQIRAAGDGIAHTPIVAVTAFDKSYEPQALAAGCNEMIRKPIDFDELDSVLQRYLPQ